jgi:hypothetical protein
LASVALLGACSRSEPAPDGPHRGLSASDGGTVRVVEQGFTARTSPTGRPLVSYGFVLENTSKTQAARDTVVVVSLADAQGRSITDYIISPKRAIGAILGPGQRTGAGWNSRVDNPGTTKISLRVTRTTWTPAGARQRVNGHDLAPAALTADAVRASTGLVSFTVHSAYPTTLSTVWADVVYRNATGRIVGGTNTRLNGHWLTSSYPPGTSPGRLADPIGPPPGAALERTAVYLYPGP